MKRFLLSILAVFVTDCAIAQVTVFFDDFNASTGGTYTTATGPIGTSTTWSLALSGADWGARIDNVILDLTNDASGAGNAVGWCFGYTATTSFTAPYTPVLNTNVGVVTWTFNMRQSRPDPGGFASGSFGVAFVLGGTSSTAATTGNGYAVVLGNAGVTDPIRLARYTGGLQGTINDIIISSGPFADIGAEYLSVKVTYTPSTDTWELFLRNDFGPPFADPAVGVLTSQSTAMDATYTGVSLDYLGGYWQGSTTASQTAYFDNTTVTVTYPNTITTGAVTGAPFSLGTCATSGPGSVAFTSTDVFFVGNTFTAQLSDDIGSFAAPIPIGSISGPSAEGNSPSGSIPIIIPPGTVSGTGYLIRVVSIMPAIIGSSSAPFQVIQAGYCASSHTDYYRSITNGDWEDPTTWESSPDGLVWISPATLAPVFNSKSILIRNTDTVTIASGATADSLIIQSGGELIHSNGAALTLNDGTGTDMTIQSGGTYVLNGTQPTGSGTVEVQSGAIVRVDANSSPGESDNFALASNSNVTFRTGSIYDWNTNTFTPSWSGEIYFINTESPTYRFSQSPNFNLGGNSITIIYGFLQANANLTIQGTATKTFTNGIIGTAKVDASGSTGLIIINGTTALLAGDTLKLPPLGLQISGSTVTMSSSKVIIGDVSLSGSSKIILGNYDLTVSGSINGYGPTAFVQTNGTGYLKMNAVGGYRVFPVGFSSSNMVYINNGRNSDYSVRVEDGINPVANSIPTYGINRTWYIFASVPTDSVEVTLWYNTADANPGALPQPQNMEFLLYSGSAWSIIPNNTNILPGGGGPPWWSVVTTAKGLTISTTPVPYILGINGGWILPVDCIISTRAQKRNNTGIISWTVNSCAEVNSFEVQRSVNNSGFRTIGTVSPVANQTDFNFTDAALANGTNLYRIKVNRFTGSTKFSNTTALIHNSNDILITAVAPNPVHNQALLTVSTGRSSVVDFKVYNMSGSLVRQWQSGISEGNNVIEINVSELPAGMYTIFASSAGANTVSRFIKQ